MDIRQWIKEYLSQHMADQDGALIKAAIELYHATQDGDFRHFALDALAACVDTHTPVPAYAAESLFFALKETGEEIYHQVIEERMKGLRSQENLPPEELTDVSLAQPFCMAYEMKLGGMEKVADVVRQFKAVRTYLWNKETCLHRDDIASEECSLRANAVHLMALADTIGLCREELYEHYRALVDLYRESLAGMLGPDWANHAEDACALAMVAYALFKGVRLGLIDPEKYLPVGKRIFTALPRENMEPAYFALAYSEYLRM